MSNCENYVSEEDIRALKESEQHIEHVARSRDSSGNKSMSVTDVIRGESVSNRTLDGLEKLYTDKIGSLGYQQMGDYATGIKITARDQIVFHNGSWYMYRGELPHVTAGVTLPDDGGIWSEANPDGLWVDVGFKLPTPENVLNYKTPDNTFQDCVNLAKSNSRYRGQIYIPFGVYISDSTDQQTYWGEGVVNRTNGEPNFNFVKVTSGRTDGTTRELYGVIRQNTQKSGWYFIEDFAHRKNGFKDVISIDENDPYKLILKYDFTARFVGNMNITVDEWFAKGGVIVGNSVGRDEAFLWAHRDACFTVENQSLRVAANGFFGDTITATKGDDGAITITHPTVLSGTDTAMIAVYRPTEGVIQTPAIVSTTATTIKYAMFGHLAGSISFSNDKWNVETSAYIKPEVVIDATGITLSHPDFANGLLFVSARAGGWGFADVERQGASPKIVLRDYAGNIINPMLNPAKYQIYFNSTAITKQAELKGGVTIHRSNVALKWENLYGESGNIWIGGTMEV